MSWTSATTTGSFARQGLALLTYLILMIALFSGAFAAAANLLNSFAGLREGKAMLARLDRQAQRLAARQDSASGAMNGPPFLMGKTINIAGAALQERVEGAVKRAGGNVLSSQIDLHGPHAAEGFVGLTESLEIGQASLQPLLYDLEAGMPYLFIENLAIQAPQAFGEAEGAPMRVLISLSGQWREAQ